MAITWRLFLLLLISQQIRLSDAKGAGAVKLIGKIAGIVTDLFGLGSGIAELINNKENDETRNIVQRMDVNFEKLSKSIDQFEATVKTQFAKQGLETRLTPIWAFSHDTITAMETLMDILEFNGTDRKYYIDEFLANSGLIVNKLDSFVNKLTDSEFQQGSLLDRIANATECSASDMKYYSDFFFEMFNRGIVVHTVYLELKNTSYNVLLNEQKKWTKDSQKLNESVSTVMIACLRNFSIYFKNDISKDITLYGVQTLLERRNPDMAFWGLEVDQKYVRVSNTTDGNQIMCLRKHVVTCFGYANRNATHTDVPFVKIDVSGTDSNFTRFVTQGFPAQIVELRQSDSFEMMFQPHVPANTTDAVQYTLSQPTLLEANPPFQTTSESPRLNRFNIVLFWLQIFYLIFK